MYAIEGLDVFYRYFIRKLQSPEDVGQYKLFLSYLRS